MPQQIIPPYRDLVADGFIAELEGVEPVARNGAVTQSDYRAAQDFFQLLLQRFDVVERVRVFDLLADDENGGGELAGPFPVRPTVAQIAAKSTSGPPASPHTVHAALVIEPSTSAHMRVVSYCSSWIWPVLSTMMETSFPPLIALYDLIFPDGTSRICE